MPDTFKRPSLFAPGAEPSLDQLKAAVPQTAQAADVPPEAAEALTQAEVAADTLQKATAAGPNPAAALTTGAVQAAAAQAPPKLAKIAPLATSVLQALNSGADPMQVAASIVPPALSMAAPEFGQIASMAAPAMQALNPAASAAAPMMAASAQALPADDNPFTGRAISDFASPPSMFTPPAADAGNDPTPAQALTGIAGPAQFDETRRLLRFYGPLLGDKRLFIQSITGSAALSEVGHCTLRLLSLHAGIDLKEVLSKNVTVTIKLADGREHPINGYISRFRFSHSDGGLAYYEADLVPWLWYLDKRVNSRIFQQMNVLDVLDKLFKEYGGLADYDIRVSRRPKPVDYIVQYDESDLHFASRLLEAYGLFYYFEHRRNGHKLVICDDSTDQWDCPQQTHHAVVKYNAGPHVDSEDNLTQLSAERELQPGVVALTTYDYKQPGAMLYVEQPTLADQGEVPTLQVFSGNPAFVYPSVTDGNLEAQRRMEVFEWQAKVFHAQAECRGIEVGHTFRLTDHHWFKGGDQENATFLVVGAEFEARNNFGHGDDANADVYGSRLLLIRRKIPYRPVQRHPKPVMRGPQMATVVGPKGVETYTDKLGRIKVQFPWDRYGRNNENSSCWIRVSQPWAGRGWGTVSIPRINQEIIIDFFEGDPDRPVCVGRLYNAEQTPPYGLPDGAHMMGFHSNSTPGGGGHCEMVIHDKKGQELINLHSQKDMTTTVQNNQVTVVNGPHQTNTVTTGDQTNTVKKAITIESQTEHITAKAKQNVQVQSTDANVIIDAKVNLTLKASGHTIVIGPEGILIDGKMVKIAGPGGIFLNE